MYEAEYLFSDHLESVIAVRARGERLSAPRFEFDYDQRTAIFQRAPSEYHYPEVPSGPGAAFRVAPGLIAKAWNGSSDGVAFEARCRDESGGWLTLLELEIPTSEPRNRRWHDQDLPLQGCSTPSTEIALSTACGPSGNCDADWAVWGDPHVVHQEVFDPKPAQLAILISIDTLRPDRLSLHGAARETSPELQRLAHDGIVFEDGCGFGALDRYLPTRPS